jgi:prophage maintenance system killer protein
LRRPTIAIAVAFNRAVREDDEWFDEPDDLDRVKKALAAIDEVDDPIDAAAVLAYRISRAHGFAEGNKRTALLLAKWLLDRNGIAGEQVFPPDDRVLGDLLVRAASGLDVEDAIVGVFRSHC